jgi:hypothetical protein
MISANVRYGIKPEEVKGKTYALKKGEPAYTPSNLEGAKPERLGEVEGVEIKAVLRWVNGICGNRINKLRISKNGLTISFCNSVQTIAGRVSTPLDDAANNNTKESGFAGVRTANIFSTFRKGTKALLWWKENKQMFIKESPGNLSWRHKLPALEEAEAIPNLTKMQVGTVKMDIADIAEVRKMNKGKRVAEKYIYAVFWYADKKVTVYAIHEDQYGLDRSITKLDELEAIEGVGTGIAIYRLEELDKLLKGAKHGIVRIEEMVPLKVSVRMGSTSKAVAFLTPVSDTDLREWIVSEIGAPKTEEAKEVEEELKEEEINGMVPLDYKDWTTIKEGVVENSEAPNYKSGVKLEQNKSLFRIIVAGCYPRGYAKEAEAVGKYEWLTRLV